MSAEPVHQHPLLTAVRAARADLAAVAEAEPCYLTTSAKEAALVELSALQAQADELRLRVLASADDVADKHGARNAGAWFAAETHSASGAAHADLEVGQALDTRYEHVRAAMRAGRVNLVQAKVIVTALDKLPTGLDPAARLHGEQHLVQLAGQFGPRELRVLGDKLLQVVAPDVADEIEARALEAEERRARLVNSIRTRLADGIMTITLRVPAASGTRFLSYLEAYSSPRQRDEGAAGEVERLPRHRRLGNAFCALLERLDPATLPDHGGDATTIIVTIDETKLRQDLATAGFLGGLDGDLTITASEARRLACNAKILPAVLNAKSEILDLGRTKRLFTPAQRKALRLRDRHCRAEGCTIPATWCEAHHRNPWSHGGHTDLADGVLLCSFHHHKAHDTRYLHELLPSGDWRFHRRT